ncbi:MAG: hypothetical protein IJT59_01900 [Desulfovibrionaceae bacterium]|nr:hypothetical protein [Desulfovibrionaceae bacterium]
MTLTFPESDLKDLFPELCGICKFGETFSAEWLVCKHKKDLFPGNGQFVLLESEQTEANGIIVRYADVKPGEVEFFELCQTTQHHRARLKTFVAPISALKELNEYL